MIVNQQSVNVNVFELIITTVSVKKKRTGNSDVLFHPLF